MLSKLAKYSDWSLVSLRAGIGIVFLIHGIGKLLSIGPFAVGISGTAGFLTSLGIPAAIFFAWIVALAETFGGLFILVGFLTRYAAVAVAIDMIVAISLVHFKNGFSSQNGGYEFPLVLLLGAIALILSGAGNKLVLEKKLFQKEL